MKQSGKFEIEISPETTRFINGLEEYGAKYRYYEVSYSTKPFDIARLDRAVWELRRYCQPLGNSVGDIDEKTGNGLALELDRVRRAKVNNEKGTCVMGGALEKIIEKKTIQHVKHWFGTTFSLVHHDAKL